MQANVRVSDAIRERRQGNAQYLSRLLRHLGRCAASASVRGVLNRALEQAFD
jgi:hypothetical protein